MEVRVLDAVTLMNALARGESQIHLLATLLAEAGLSPPQLAALCPRLHPKTRGRLAAMMRSLLLERALEEQRSRPQEPSGPAAPSSPAGQVVEAALSASVSEKVALEALLRYRNPLEFVLGTLRNIESLRRTCRTVTNPTGLFVRSMKTKQPVKLPQGRPAAPARPVRVGQLAWCEEAGRWLPISALNERSVWVDDEETHRQYHLVRSGVRFQA